jgi:HEAT repeat protein
VAPIVMVLAVIGIGALLVWSLTRRPEPPAPPPKSDSPAERAQRLARLLKLASSDERRDAAKGLGNMGPEAKDTVPQLIELLWDEAEKVRKAAAVALDQIDKDWPKRDEARAAVPHLIPFLWGEVQEFREAATQTLDRIDQDWPKRDEARRAVADLLDLLGEPVSDHMEVAKILDRLDANWRKSEKAKTVAVKMAKQAYKTSPSSSGGRENTPLDGMDNNWQESPEAKRALSELIDELTAEASKSRYVSPLAGGPLGSVVEKTAIRALIEKLDTRSRDEFETTVAVLDSLDEHWPQYKEAKTVATKLTARLLAWNANPGKCAIPPILLETLDRMDPTWAQPDNARKAIPELLKGLDGNRDDVVALAALLLRIDEESMELEEERIIPRLVEKSHANAADEVVLAIKTLGRIGKDPAVVVPRLLKFAEGGNQRDYSDRQAHQIGLALVEALGEFGKEAEAAIPALLEFLKMIDKVEHRGKGDWTAELHQATLRALGRIGKQPAVVVPVIVDYLRSNRPGTSQDVRHAAAEALGGFGKHTAIAVPKLFNGERIDWNYDVDSAIEALGNIGPPAVPFIQKCERDDPYGQRFDDPSRGIAIKALGQIKASPTTVIPHLIPRLLSPA